MTDEDLTRLAVHLVDLMQARGVVAWRGEVELAGKGRDGQGPAWIGTAGTGAGGQGIARKGGAWRCGEGRGQAGQGKDRGSKRGDQ